MGNPEQGIKVNTDRALAVALATISDQSRDIVFLKAAVQDLQLEVTRLSTEQEEVAVAAV
jgi:hypothetical protein